jgi:hypothetical protein
MALHGALPQQCAVIIVNTQTRTTTLDIDLTGLVGTGLVFEGVWNGGCYAVNGQRLHGVTIPARDAAVLISANDGVG